MKISFKLKQEVLKNGKQPLHLSISHNGKRNFIRIGEINSKNWDAITETVKGKGKELNDLKSRLVDVKFRVRKITEEQRQKKMIVSSRKLKELILDEQRDDFIVLAQRWIDDRLAQDELTYRTHVKHKSTIKKLKKYIEEKSSSYELLIQNFNKAFVIEYEKYMKLELNNHINTITSNLKFFKAFCTHLVFIEKIKQNDHPFNGWKMKHIKPKRKALTIEQIDTIRDLSISNTNLKKAQEIFLFLCATALRINEALQIRIDDIHDNYLTHLVSKQTAENRNSKTKLPLSPQLKLSVEKLIKKTKPNQIFLFDYLDASRHTSPSRLLSDISSCTAVINKHLKLIAKKGNIEKLSTHIGRHSLATIGRSRGMSLSDLQLILNHKNERSTKMYVAETDEQKINAFNKRELLMKS